ncbi:Aspartate aminotransferase, mitochondrial [Phytophthora pseudosyringae]|uniref:aspartate transaminase n=1 Tax=Phytophthora pseudosyringae TaxID=221518 RepID=A0A8T1VYL8_9STRA|nr:Aspartate aminotransferase, mitochondrial [Phytophthora pseudosyringae]
MLARRFLLQSTRGFATKAAAGQWLAGVPMGPADPILGLTERFNKDSDPRKISLGVGAYRDDNGKPYVLPSVLEAEKRIMAAGKNKEYAGIAGMKDFVDLSLQFAYGEDCDALKEGRVTGVQTISGTGGVRLAGEFFAKFLGEGTPIYMPNPTWGNHIPIMKNAGMEVRRYTYYEPASRGLDFSGLINDLEGAPDGSVFLLHACAHNPTGVDPTMEQWRKISDVMKAKKHVPFFDCAYQGFASGDATRDAAAIRHFVKEGHNIFLSQSYAKNFGLYGERVGALSVVTASKEEADRVQSQLKIIIRPMYSNPPIHGSLIVSTVLSDAQLKKQWYSECKGMADRIISMRTALRSAIEKIENANGIKSDWCHITDQIGMFCYTGLTEAQVTRMIEKHHIYLTKDGRVSMAGVTSKNVEYLAQSIAEVVQSA